MFAIPPFGQVAGIYAASGVYACQLATTVAYLFGMTSCYVSRDCGSGNGKNEAGRANVLESLGFIECN